MMSDDDAVREIPDERLDGVSGGFLPGAVAGYGAGYAEEAITAPTEAQESYNDSFNNPNTAAPHDGEYTPEDSIYDGTNSAP